MVSDAVLKSVLQFPENLKNKFLVLYLILSLYLLYIQADVYLEAVLKDLKKIEVSSEIDAYLYTADVNYTSHCNRSVIKCFQLEMQVVSHESKFEDKNFRDSVNRIIRLLGNVLPHEMLEKILFPKITGSLYLALPPPDATHPDVENKYTLLNKGMDKASSNLKITVGCHPLGFTADHKKIILSRINIKRSSLIHAKRYVGSSQENLPVRTTELPGIATRTSIADFITVQNLKKIDAVEHELQAYLLTWKRILIS